jgi:hypothetical protein
VECLQQDRSSQETACAQAIPASSCIVLLHQGTDAVTDAQLAAIFIDRILEDPKACKLYMPYLDTLPTRDYCFSPTPDFLSDEEIWLLPKSIVQRVMERKQQIIATSSMLEGIDFETLQFVTWLVTSRKFTITQRNQQRTVLLIPFFDFVNHSSDDCPNAKLKVVEQKDGEEESFYMLESIRRIAVNDHVTITYGSGRQ